MRARTSNLMIGSITLAAIAVALIGMLGIRKIRSVQAQGPMRIVFEGSASGLSKGGNAAALAGIGETIVFENSGSETPEAEALFERALAELEFEYFPSQVETLARCVAVYETFPGWTEALSGARGWSDLPANAQAYVRRLEGLLEAPVQLIGVGEARDEIVQL